MIRPCDAHEFEVIWTIINDGARAYDGMVPADCLKDPYMAKSELEDEIKDGVVFWGYEDSGELVGVMGIQDVGEVTLIRHAYVRMPAQGRGIGGKLLSQLRELANKPLLIGTWAHAKWAIGFYEKHGFALLRPQDKNYLIPKYWKIPQRQAETSVVLASPEWLSAQSISRLDSR
jgi:N-acetylglutamate synthase-like GNAT family acetyltransferase